MEIQQYDPKGIEALANNTGRPIPGQSLTTEPKNVPYENPPEIVDPELAAMAHLQKINNADAVEDLLFFLESGVSVVTLTEGLCRVAVKKY